MRGLLCSSAAALAALLLPGGAAAQMGTELQKLPDVYILVEEFVDAAAKCGVTESGLDAAVRVPVDASRLGLRERRKSSDGSFLYAVFNLQIQDVGCIANVSLELGRDVIVKSSGSTAYGATVWRRAAIISGPAYDFGERVNALLREYTTQFLSEWIQQNPKP